VLVHKYHLKFAQHRVLAILFNSQLAAHIHSPSFSGCFDVFADFPAKSSPPADGGPAVAATSPRCALKIKSSHVFAVASSPASRFHLPTLKRRLSALVSAPPLESLSGDSQGTTGTRAGVSARQCAESVFGGLSAAFEYMRSGNANGDDVCGDDDEANERTASSAEAEAVFF